MGLGWRVVWGAGGGRWWRARTNYGVMDERVVDGGNNLHGRPFGTKRCWNGGRKQGRSRTVHDDGMGLANGIDRGVRAGGDESGLGDVWFREWWRLSATLSGWLQLVWVCA